MNIHLKKAVFGKNLLGLLHREFSSGKGVKEIGIEKPEYRRTYNEKWRELILKALVCQSLKGQFFKELNTRGKHRR